MPNGVTSLIRTENASDFLRIAVGAGLGVIALCASTVLSGPLEWVLISTLLLAAAMTLDPYARKRLRELARPAILTLFIVVAILGAGRLALSATADHGTLFQPPVSGGSDQIDYMDMAFTFATQSKLGVTRDSEVARPVLEWAEERNLDSNLIAKWHKFAEEQEEGYRQYAYRPYGYSILLGSAFKVTGYDPTLGPGINAVLYGLTAGMVFLLVARWLALWVAVLAVGSFLSIQIIQQWAFQSMPETLSLALFTLFVLFMMEALPPGSSKVWTLAAGVTAGLLVLVKPMFLTMSVLLLGCLAVWSLFRRRDLVKRLVGAACIAGVLILPWFFYNYSTTGHLSLVTSTQGWVDIPSVYSQEYVEGENRYAVREKLFREYADATGRPIEGDVGRALAAREIFFEMARSNDFMGRLPDLVLYKLSDALRAVDYSHYDHILRFMAILAIPIAAISVSRRRLQASGELEGVLVLSVSLVSTHLATLVLLFPDRGRLFMASWVPIIFLASFSAVWMYRGALSRLRRGVGEAGRETRGHIPQQDAPHQPSPV